ncbi:HNH endonuclease [Bacillus cereus]|uniref:HNH endonuclease n=1 Tax=Bacillus cereus TaxID=1396 RepID=UPI000BF92E61|nr:HNH endonuclease [Bacillus cereus]MEB9946765.1 HNH endonuclease [Bacillus cereus]PFF41009.1 restriction endonuclease [Bacillus cereus]PGN93004.1 restriction endonuclease [Bacillus cereus]PGV31192.1 restriction endonuclease [Bacillus cereus]PGX87170.1 restriction endonuclease [Bacillus cereus]
MTSYIIPYLDPKKHNREEDPLFSEYTYGDEGNRGMILKTKVSKGDFLFFYKSIENTPCITAFYEVEKVLDIHKAKMDNIIMTKYRNPHLFRNEIQENEAIVFGNPEKSMILDTPLVVNRALLEELSINYNPSPNLTELQALTLKLRWKRLNNSQVKLLLNKVNPLHNESFLLLQKELESPIVLDETEKELVVKARIGQSIFKKALLAIEKKCKLCGVSDERFLVASHIKRWSQSNHKERLDVNNGLLLCPNHDALFDKGYISFNEDGRILISESLDDVTKVFLNINDKVKIQMNEIQKQYMKWHRENVFKSMSIRLQKKGDFT